MTSLKVSTLLFSYLFLVVCVTNASNASMGPPLNTNLALGKSASQSSDNNGSRGQADAAVDGNSSDSDFWHPAASVTSTNYEASAWWEVDLGAVYDLTEVKLHNQTNGNSTSNYHLFVSDVPFYTNDLNTIKNDPQILDIYESGTMGNSSDYSINRTGRYIRVQGETWGFITLAEVEVYGATPGADPTVTLTAPSSVSGDFVMNVDFSESISGLTLSDFTISNCSLSNLQGSGTSYTVDISPDNIGALTILLPAGTVQDGDGNNNLESNRLIINYAPGISNTYCSVGPTTPWNYYITGVSIGDIQNGNQPISERKSGDVSPPGARDYSTMSTDVVAGNSYIISSVVTTGFYQNITKDGSFQVWVDFNQDGDFEDAGELTIDSIIQYTNGGSAPVNHSIQNVLSIPIDAVAGATRMRILFDNGDTPWGPCETTTNLYGEYEDYTLNIVPDGMMEEAESSIVWDSIPANVIREGDIVFKKFYPNPMEYFRGANVLAANTAGWIEFTINDDINTNGDWVYVGLVERDTTVRNEGTQQANFLIGVRSNEFLSPGNNDNILLLEKGALTSSGGFPGGTAGSVFRISREVNGNVVYSLNGIPLHTTTTQNGDDPNDFILEPVFYILNTGLDNQVSVSFNISDSFIAEDLVLAGRYTKMEATPSSLGSIDLNVGGGEPPYMYSWSNANLRGSNPTNVPEGTYTVVVEDAAGTMKAEDIDIYTMHDVEWEVVESNIEVSEDNYVLKNTSTNIDNRLFSQQKFSADENIFITVQLNKDLIADYTPGALNDDFNIVFKDVEVRADALGEYGLKINGAGSVLLFDDNYYNQSADTITFGKDLAFSLDEFEYAIRLKNRIVTVYKNNKALYSGPILSEIDSLQVGFKLSLSTLEGVAAEIKVSKEASLPPDLTQYTNLKRQLDSGFIIYDSSDDIRFKYIEDYAVVNDESSDLICKLYNWQRSIIKTYTVSKEYGANWKRLKLPTGLLTTGQYYLLEVENTNKGDTQYLRFKYE